MGCVPSICVVEHLGANTLLLYTSILYLWWEDFMKHTQKDSTTMAIILRYGVLTSKDGHIRVVYIPVL